MSAAVWQPSEYTCSRARPNAMPLRKAFCVGVTATSSFIALPAHSISVNA